MKTKLKRIFGNWDLGYSLAKHTLHSTYLGDNEHGRPQFDTKRTEVGEALYQLKYRSDWGQAKAIAQAMADTAYPDFSKVGLIVPMPASNVRARQPVNEIAAELGKIVGKPVFYDILQRTPTGQSLKDLGSKDERAKALAGKITLSDDLEGDGPWNFLLVDDRYDTGASVEEACKVLRTYEKVRKIYVVTATW